MTAELPPLKIEYVYCWQTKQIRKDSKEGSASDEEWFLCDMQPSSGSLVSQ